ncbi:hypothetical protein FIV00_15150 [Labrenzia sp. THAF82]|nr:hypothetical protein FIV00_15140 [Labrenzia sp. THAF82]QFT31828.1 hypothetical protein FIV00_15150 [Labrenzia sp. THAF82]
MAKQRKHQVILTLSFDKPVSAAIAKSEARNQFKGGEYFIAQMDPSDAGLFKVIGVKSAPLNSEQ